MTTFGWGCVGAVAPEIVRWFRISRSTVPEEWKKPAYWLATALYVALGGAFATLIAQPDGYAGFLAGVSTQYAVLGVVKAAEPPQKPTAAEELTTRHVGPVGVAWLYIINHASYLGRRS